MKHHYNIFICNNEMLGIYLMPTKLGMTNQLSTKQLSHAVNHVNK